MISKVISKIHFYELTAKGNKIKLFLTNSRTLSILAVTNNIFFLIKLEPRSEQMNKTTLIINVWLIIEGGDTFKFHTTDFIKLKLFI